MTKQLISKLNMIAKNLDDSYNLNDGGCGYFAYYALRTFIFPSSINYSTIEYYDSYDSDYPYHIALKVNGIIINPSTYKHEDYERPIQRETHLTYLELYDYYKLCCSSYNDFKKRNIKYIRNEINKLRENDSENIG